MYHAEDWRLTVKDEAAGAAAYDAASAGGTVPCAAHQKTWSALEQDYADASGPEQALTLTMISTICAPCPALAQCRSWAEVEKYTGLAAGGWYRSGVPQPLRRTGNAAVGVG